MMGDGAAVHLANALLVNCTITSVGLGDNEIKSAGAEALATALKENKTVLYFTAFQNRVSALCAAACALPLC
jgi:hypothetical protein